ncbi:MAG: aspartate 1-decarboxylase [bacterium]|nr:MAG: aspartate 1-decarboxylase [bacterium]
MLPPIFPIFVRNVIYPIYRGLRGDDLLSVLEELERSQWLSPTELEEIQWQRLEGLLRQAVTHVPYYRDLFREAGVMVEDIQGPADLRAVPLLTKEIIRQNSSRLVSRDPLKKGEASSTGGSTGEPLYFYCDRASGPVRRANTLRAIRWTGADIGDRQIFFWGFHLDMSLKERLVDTVKSYFNNIAYLSTFDMSEPSMRRYASRLRRYRPGLVVGYPSALALFCEFCKKQRIPVYHPRAVITSGERTFQHQREIIEEVFRASAFDRYGTREFANIAHECEEHSGLHLFNDLFFVEIIDEKGDQVPHGGVGEMVVTDLSNFYMPFIRYRTGDLAVSSGRVCSCGRGLPLIERIEGRSFDTIITPRGKSVGGFFWTWLSRAVPGIERFQIEQRERSGIIFRIVPGPEWKEEYRDQLSERIRDNCGQDFRVTFAIVEDIPLTPSGKSRFIVSNIEERLVIKSKIHKARITGENPGGVDSIMVDMKLLELAGIAPYEKVLIVDNTNGSRIETVMLPGDREGGRVVAGGATVNHIHTGDEISIMAFTWSSDTRELFKNILVDEHNRFVRYLKEVAGETI